MYGLPELFRDELARRRARRRPGLLPDGGLARPGAARPGRADRDARGSSSTPPAACPAPARAKFPFCGTDEDFIAYGLLDHRHTPEIEQNLTLPRRPARAVHAAPGPDEPRHPRHLLRPPDGGGHHRRRCSAVSPTRTPASPSSSSRERPPSTKATLGSNAAHLTARADPRTGWVVALAAIDNLVKGASGQAVQCANLALGLDETAGLAAVGVYP